MSALLALLLNIFLPQSFGVLLLFLEESDRIIKEDLGVGRLELGRIGVGSIGVGFGFAFFLEI